MRLLHDNAGYKLIIYNSRQQYRSEIQDRMSGRMCMPSWITPFCPTSGMSTQVFFQSPMGPLHRSRVKIRGHMIAHRTPSAPGLLGLRSPLNSRRQFRSKLKTHLFRQAYNTAWFLWEQFVEEYNFVTVTVTVPHDWPLRACSMTPSCKMPALRKQVRNLLTYSSICLRQAPPVHKYSSLRSTNWLHRASCCRPRRPSSCNLIGWSTQLRC